MTKQLVRFGAAVMTTLLALVVLWQFRIVVVYVLISLTLAAVLRPLVNRLVGRGFVVRAAWILLYLVALGCFGFLLFLTGETAINEIQQLAQTVSVQDAWMLPVWLEGQRVPTDAGCAAATAESSSSKHLPATRGSSCCRPYSASPRASAAS